MLRESLLFLNVLALVNNLAGGLDVFIGVADLQITEEQNSETWLVGNTDPLIVGNITFSLKASQTGDSETYRKFTLVPINASYAELRLNYTFDFENADDIKERRFIIASTANSIESKLEVAVKIIDVNDHSPSFTNLPSTINVSKASCVGMTLFAITGEDQDGNEIANNFNIISFSITNGNINNKFSADFDTGQSALLKLDSRLDYDEDTEVYNLTINATDERDNVNPHGLWVVSYLVIQVTNEGVGPRVLTDMSSGYIMANEGDLVNLLCSAQDPEQIDKDSGKYLVGMIVFGLLLVISLVVFACFVYRNYLKVPSTAENTNNEARSSNNSNDIEDNPDNNGVKNYEPEEDDQATYTALDRSREEGNDDHVYCHLNEVQKDEVLNYVQVEDGPSTYINRSAGQKETVQEYCHLNKV